MTAESGISAAALWAVERQSRVQMETILGADWPTIRAAFVALGFRRRGNRYTAGPCLRCAAVRLPRSDFPMTGGTCRRCLADFRPSPAAVALAAERRKRDDRWRKHGPPDTRPHDGSRFYPTIGRHRPG